VHKNQEHRSNVHKVRLVVAHKKYVLVRQVFEVLHALYLGAVNMVQAIPGNRAEAKNYHALGPQWIAKRIAVGKSANLLHQLDKSTSPLPSGAR
jgi:uncharacterized membrane protein